jgi:hypothetical protein
MVIHSRHC